MGVILLAAGLLRLPVTCASGVPQLAAGPTGESLMSRPLTIRLHWGGGDARTWFGKLEVGDGQLVSVHPRSMTPDAAATALIRDNDLTIQSWQPSSFGGVDIQLRASAEGRLHLQLASREEPNRKIDHWIEVRSLLERPWTESIDQSGNRILVERPAYDRIALDLTRDHLIFAPRETFAFQWAPFRSGVHGHRVKGSVRLRPVGQSTPTAPIEFSQTCHFRPDAAGSADWQSVNLTIPEAEGVYRLELTLESPAGESSDSSVLTRGIELIVIDDQLEGPPSEPNWRVATTVDPADSSERARLVSWPRAAPRSEILRNEAVRGVQRRIGGEPRALTELGPGGWVAVPLTFDNPADSHLLDIEYLAEGPMGLGISLLELDSNGQLASRGADSGVALPGLKIAGSDPGTLTHHRFTVWPVREQAYLLLANRHRNESVTIGTINVMQASNRGDSMLASPGQLRQSTVARGGRRYFPYLDQPIFARDLGVTGELDLPTGESYESWTTFYEAARRLARELKKQGASGIYFPVLADGCSIYPSRRVSSAPRFDSGVFFSDGRDPVKKDVVELLYRVLQRNELEFVPVLIFNGPLADVERQRVDQGEAGSDVDLVDLQRNRRPSQTGCSIPIYNPLSPVVQQAVTEVVAEFVDRYGELDSFSGMALATGPDCYTLLPGRQWGYDRTTVSRFAQVTPAFDPSRDWSQQREHLLTEFQDSWTDWRASQMSNWYQRLASTVTNGRPRTRLKMVPRNLLQNPDLRSALTPILHRPADPAAALREVGLNRSVETTLTEGSPAATTIQWLTPHRLAPDRSLASERVAYAVQQSRDWSKLWGRTGGAELFYHPASWAQFGQLQRRPEFSDMSGPLMRLQPIRFTGAYGHAAWAQAIKRGDTREIVEGGERFSTGQDPARAEFLSVFTQLPDQPFNEVAHPEAEQAALPVVVRQLSADDGNWFYLVNGSPWPVTVRLTAHGGSADQPPPVESLSGTPVLFRSPIVPVSGQLAGERRFEATVVIAPFGLSGGKLPAAYELTRYTCSFPHEVGRELKKNVLRLQSRLARAQQAPPRGVLENGDFRGVTGQPIPGWSIGQQPSDRFQLGSTQAASLPSGTASVPADTLLDIQATESSPTWIRSHVIPVPETGRLSVSVWVRADNDQPQPALRISIEGDTPEGSYYRFGSVGQRAPNPSQNRIGASWKRFAVHFDDLPIDQLVDLRIGFDVMNRTRVQITGVRSYDYWLDENDAQVITQLLASIEAMLLRPEMYERCRLLLDDYWLRFLDQYVPASDGQLEAARRAVPAVAVQNRRSADDQSSATSQPKRESGRGNMPMLRRWRGRQP